MASEELLGLRVAVYARFSSEGQREASAAVAEKLRGLERAADAQRSKVAVLERRARTAIRLPSPDELMGIVFELEKRLSADTTQAREELRRIFRDGKITLLPQPGGFYVARSEILPLVLLTLAPPADSSSEEVGEGWYPASSCAGAIPSVDSELFPGFRKSAWLERATCPTQSSVPTGAHPRDGLYAVGTLNGRVHRQTPT